MKAFIEGIFCLDFGVYMDGYIPCAVAGGIETSGTVGPHPATIK
jgi:hypothetical protein